MLILIAESDPGLATFLQHGFNSEQYAVDLVTNGSEVLGLVLSRKCDAAILDLNFLQPDDLEVVRRIRSAFPHLPILVLADLASPDDRAQVLDCGADDLVLKPFAFSELSARLRAVLRRSGHVPDAVLRVDDLELNRVEHCVRRAQKRIDLTPKEFALLEYLMRNSGRRVSRAEIIEHVWNLSFDTLTNVVDVYINYVRKKVDTASERKLIYTVRGVGYQLRPPAAPNAPMAARENAHVDSN